MVLTICEITGVLGAWIDAHNNGLQNEVYLKQASDSGSFPLKK